MPSNNGSIRQERPASIGDLVRADAPTFSFEFFPPKDSDAERVLWQTIRELEQLRPSFVSVTYGAGGTTRDTTVEVTERLATETTMLPMAHLTAVGHSMRELRNVIGRLVDAGIRNILAIRGDPKGDPLGEWIQHPEGLLYAEELVELIKEAGDFCVGVAAFPHKHPRSSNIDEDTRYLVQKLRAGADFAITQMFFEAEDYLRLRDRVAASGCDAPIVPCVMPVTRMATIERSVALSGAPFPPALAAKFEQVSGDPSAVRSLGIDQAGKLSEQLLAEGVPGIHFITFNRSTAAREVWLNIAGKVKNAA
ncbi:MAG: methylenetetrahydrofolate reductase [NAD(P)H] [Longispora sp.]|nr:methylenetetrahydrofolate reductase [NAD(P)H] [Longispora sp. (in: high G+C Gram-positive bacteria)]